MHPQYTEFTAYAALLGGASPHVLQKSVVARHQQTWKLREYHLIASDASNSDSGIDLDMDSNVEPLPSGDPLRSYFPNGTHIKEDREGLSILVPHRSRSVRYERASRITSQYSKRRREGKVADVIIMGEVWLLFLIVMGPDMLTTGIRRVIPHGVSST